MKIVLTRDLTGPKAVEHGFVEGATFDWPRSVISTISATEGDDWFRFSAEVERSMRRSSAANMKATEDQKPASEPAKKEAKTQTAEDKAAAAIKGTQKAAKG